MSVEGGEEHGPTRAWRADENGDDDPSADPLADPEEQRVLLSTLDSFRQYRRQSHYNTTHRRRQNLYALPPHHRNVLTAPPFSLLDHLSAVDEAIDSNADIADAIFARGLASFNIDDLPASTTNPSDNNSNNTNKPTQWLNSATPDQHAKAHSTIRQLYRDWTAAGFATEVKPVLDLILASLRRHNIQPSPSRSSSSSSSSDTHTHPNILVPGAGLGRILLELCLAGYNATGNEISYHQLLASDWILNGTSSSSSSTSTTTAAAAPFTIYPFVNNFTNNLSAAHQLRSYPVPDVHPATALALAQARAAAAAAAAAGGGGGGDPTTPSPTTATPPPTVGEMGMAAGDFTTSFTRAEYRAAFDAVTTVYFIDTAPNLLRYIETIHHCLRPGGVWVNVGPLLWHFDGTGPPRSSSKEDTNNKNNDNDDDGDDHTPPPPPAQQDQGIGQPGAFELADDQVKELVRKMGFVIHPDEELLLRDSGAGAYMQDPDSMLQSRYRPSYWVATKVEREREQV